LIQLSEADQKKYHEDDFIANYHINKYQFLRYVSGVPPSVLAMAWVGRSNGIIIS